MKNILFLICLVIVIISCGQEESLVFINSNKRGNISFEKEDVAKRVQTISIDKSLFELSKTLKANWFDSNIRFTIDSINHDDSNTLYSGVTIEDDESYILITEVNDALAGNIYHNGQLYQIRSVGKNLYELIELDQTKYEDEKDAIIPDLTDSPPLLKDCPNTDPDDFIDLMVVYTDDAKAAAGSEANMLAEVYLAIHETNLGYSTSGVNQRINLVHVLDVNYTESGDFNTDLGWLRSNSVVANARNNFSADLVIMILETGNACGLGYFMNTVSSSFDQFAFSVVKRSCSTGYYSFGHELGHNMGANHDCGQTTSNQPYPYAHGFNHCGTSKFRTVMAYNSCNEPRVLRWSNPNLTFNGTSTGNNVASCQSCNACVLNNTALTVANFRCSDSNVTDVYMKDTWNDNGTEPFTNSLNELIYLSPYIWIRKTQDNSLVHQHQHENPEYGQSNWVYTKLHNNGAQITGNLELYYTNANISIQWPSFWNLLSSTSITIPPNSTYVHEKEWTSLPASSGHYCMLARWNASADPMNSIETMDIGENTRKNNNIVWRNFNIVNLLPDQGYQVKVDFRTIANSEITVGVQRSKNYETDFFETGGKIKLKFEKKLEKEISRILISEVRKEKGWYIITKNDTSFKFADFSKELSGTIEMEIISSQKAQDEYRLDIKHLLKRQVIGGVSYAMKTNHKN